MQHSERFIRLPEVLKRTGLSRSTIYAKVATEEFPRPVTIGSRASAWLESEVLEWMEEKIRQSRDITGRNKYGA